MQVIKRDGRIVLFDKTKIENAILKAMKFGSGIVKENIATDIAKQIEDEYGAQNEVSIADIEKRVFELLIAKKQRLTARAYEGYRAVRENQRKQGTIDNKVLALIKGTHENQKDNSNKDTALISTMRDLVAEEVSKDIALRMMLPPHIAQAHNEGILYIHDLGHYLNPSFNCFSYDTRFITNKGVRSFGECYDGEEVEVVDMYGQWQKAVVHKYNKKPMQKVTLNSGRSTTTIRCTKDHRWILKDGTVTTDLKPGDVLWPLPNIQERPLYKNPEMFILGMILGDGHDIVKSNSKGMSIRLCKDKIKYKNIFEKCGYKVVYIYENGDVVLSKFGKALKKNFIENKVWEFLSTDDVIDVFNGYYCTDGSTDRNMISTADYNLLEFIKYASGMSGFYISSINVNNKPTNFSSERTLYEVRFRKHTIDQNNWKVTSIDRSDGVPRETWCVEQLVNKSFTLENGIVTGNCCLINLDDMLQNGTVINGKMITKPHSFRTACTIATQIIAQVASGQFGGQTISIAHLAPFVRISKERIYEEVKNEIKLCINSMNDTRGLNYDEIVDKITEERLAKEVRDGIQTFQYQINTLQTANGQAPFLSVFMWINEYPEYREETVMLVKEFLEQRIKGMQNEVGAWITPAFPKLLYVTDENNIHEDSEYFWLTKLAAECVTKRMMPDFISAKHMRQNYEGNVFGCIDKTCA